MHPCSTKGRVPWAVSLLGEVIWEDWSDFGVFRHLQTIGPEGTKAILFADWRLEGLRTQQSIVSVSGSNSVAVPRHGKKSRRDWKRRVSLHFFNLQMPDIRYMLPLHVVPNMVGSLLKPPWTQNSRASFCWCLESSTVSVYRSGQVRSFAQISHDCNWSNDCWLQKAMTATVTGHDWSKLRLIMTGHLVVNIFPSKRALEHPKQSRIDWGTSKTINWVYIGSFSAFQGLLSIMWVIQTWYIYYLIDN